MLVETLVSFFIFAVAVYSLYGLWAASNTAHAKAQALVTATQLAEELTATVESQGSPQLGRSEGTREHPFIRDGQPGVLKLKYSVEVRPGPSSGLVSVVTTVWAQGVTGRVEMETYVPK